jgi:hypothetical protein
MLYIEYQSVCPLSELAPSSPSPASECVPPWNQRGGHSLAGEGAGGANSDDWREGLALCLLCVLQPYSYKTNCMRST